MKEVYLYKKTAGKKAQCRNCSHYCLIPPKKRGICGAKENINGKLYSLNYAKVVACNIDPIEKKPFFHFLPGTFSLSVAAAGCNFRCLSCQNWDISQGFKKTKEIPGDRLLPDQIVKTALKNKTPSISYTYTEPAVFSEYVFDVMKLARKKGLKNAWVSNGFWSKELFDLIWPHLDAVNVDLKSFSSEFYLRACGGQLRPVLDNLKRLKEKNIWLEVTTLVIPTLNDSERTFRQIAKFIKEELGAETPWHVSKFFGAISWQLQHLPETPVETLKRAYEIGKAAGLKYVYTGNVPGLPTEDTFCSQCGALMIDRTGYGLSRHDKKGRCRKCGADLNLILK